MDTLLEKFQRKIVLTNIQIIRNVEFHQAYIATRSDIIQQTREGVKVLSNIYSFLCYNLWLLNINIGSQCTNENCKGEGRRV